MKKHLLSILVLIITTSLSQAQSPILWGVTTSGGANDYGTIFYYNTSTGIETDVYDFNGYTKGYYPQGSLIQANNGLLYGVSEGGANYSGMIFSYNIITGLETDVYDFNLTDMAEPTGSLIQANNNLLYGMAGAIGGNPGIIYSYDISNGNFNVLHEFGSGYDGYDPVSSLIQANDDNLYGMTFYGGTGFDGGGTIFRYDISTGDESVIYSFDYDRFQSNYDGQFPDGSLIQANNGLLYGMTTSGGESNSGTTFSCNLSGSESVIFNTGGYGSLIQANNELLYGITLYDGAFDAGIFSFNITTSSATGLHPFCTSNDGCMSYGAVIQASNGLLYGMTKEGGSIDSGTIYSYNINSTTETVLHNFGIGNDGYYPVGDLIEVDTPAAGINQITINNNLLIYPNPSNGEVNIISTANIDEIKVTNLIGQEIYGAQPKHFQFSFELQDAGLYFITITSNIQITTRKVIVTR